jgi:hypothetical protein
MKRGAHDDRCWEILDSLDDALRYDPYAAGERHPDLPDRFCVYQSPPLARLPTVYVLYEVDEAAGVVLLWNFEVR